MKNLKIGILLSFIAVTTTSCVKDWNCECTDGVTTRVMATYPHTKMADAKKSCNQVQQAISVSGVTCKVK
ncbi:MAG: hypothetical protein U0T31_08240 [Chitinophagales bacterium]